MGLQCFLDGGARSGLQCALADIFAALGGDGLAGLIISGFVLVPFYFAGEGDAGTPAVILILLGGIMIRELPPQYQGTAKVIVVIGGIVAFLRLAEAYVLNRSI